MSDFSIGQDRDDFIAGCIGGAAGVFVGHPFDTIKVRLQTQSQINPIYRGTADCFIKTFKTEGPRGYYKGMASPLYSLVTINCLVFGVQGYVQRRLEDPDALFSHFKAGALAGLVQTVICSPMELVKTRMQIQGQGVSSEVLKQAKANVGTAATNSSKTLYNGPIDCVKKIYKTEGLGKRGLGRGFLLTAMRETPSFGVYFYVYEYLCRRWTEGSNKTPNFQWTLLAGGLSGMASWSCTYPVDVIKSRIQADGVGGVEQYKGARDCFRKSVKKEGYRCLSRGLVSTLIRAFPVNAATFGAVEWYLNLVRPAEETKSELDQEKHRVERMFGAASSGI